MSYNGSGTFQINTTGQPVVTGTVISSTAFNALTADLATGLSTAITKDGQTATTARIPFAAGISSTLVTDSSSTSTGSIITAGGIGVAKAAYIGTTLNVASTASASKLIPTGSSVTGNGLYLPAANALGLSTNGTNAVYIDASQNVGIGTNAPASYGKVASVSGSAFGSSFTAISNSSGTDWARMDWKHQAVASTCLIYLDQTGLFNIRNDGANPIAFYTNGGNERARIDSSGNLLVGKTSTGYANVGIELRPGATASSIFCNNSVGAATIQVTNAPSAYLLAFYRQDTGGLMGYIINGASNTVSYTTSSDYRLKENITPMTGALSTVAQLKPVTYKWKNDGSDGQGFIAHELQAVVPDCVSGIKDAVDADGNPKYQGVDTSFLVATLTAAIQEQQALITALTARITALENK
jgi:hypothetical protein